MSWFIVVVIVVIRSVSVLFRVRVLVVLDLAVGYRLAQLQQRHDGINGIVNGFAHFLVGGFVFEVKFVGYIGCDTPDLLTAEPQRLYVLIGFQHFENFLVILVHCFLFGFEKRYGLRAKCRQTVT